VSVATVDELEIEAVIVRFLRDNLALDVSDVAADSPLVTSGILDSVGLVRLATLLERRLGIRIPDRDLTLEHFDTIRRIRAYVTRRARG